MCKVEKGARYVLTADSLLQSGNQSLAYCQWWDAICKNPDV